MHITCVFMHFVSACSTHLFRQFVTFDDLQGKLVIQPSDEYITVRIAAGFVVLELIMKIQVPDKSKSSAPQICTPNACSVSEFHNMFCCCETTSINSI